MKQNFGFLNNNWKGGHRRDELATAELSAKRQLEIKIETGEELLRPGVIDEKFTDFRAEIVASIKSAKLELAQLMGTLDGSEENPIISGGEILYPQPMLSETDEIPF